MGDQGCMVYGTVPVMCRNLPCNLCLGGFEYAVELSSLARSLSLSLSLFCRTIWSASSYIVGGAEACRVSSGDGGICRCCGGDGGGGIGLGAPITTVDATAASRPVAASHLPLLVVLLVGADVMLVGSFFKFFGLFDW